jgi:hypothetical protein
MNALKHKNMMSAYTGFSGSQTIAAVSAQVPKELFSRLTGVELGLVMSAIDKAYHNGRASKGEIDNCDDCYWVPEVGEDGDLIPKKALASIKKTDATEVVMAKTTHVDRDGNQTEGPSQPVEYRVTRYTMDYSERY